MSTLTLSKPDWEAVKPLLANSHGLNDRRIIAGIRWALRTGKGWRNIPGVIDNGWTTFYNRYRAWEKSGLWKKIERALKGVVKPTAQPKPQIRKAKPTPAASRKRKAAETARRVSRTKRTTRRAA